VKSCRIEKGTEKASRKQKEHQKRDAVSAQAAQGKWKASDSIPLDTKGMTRVVSGFKKIRFA
jgi:hypothetical protein